MIELTLRPTALPAKRPYVAPALVVYGDVQTLTQKLGPLPDNDGGGSFIFIPPQP